MREGGFVGEIVPVNPNRATVQGLVAVPPIPDVVGTPDIALLALPANPTIDAVEQGAERVVRVVVGLSAGFAEIGGAANRRRARSPRSRAAPRCACSVPTASVCSTASLAFTGLLAIRW
jgi:acyl-CoA synthetase (NDP forming)